MKVIIGPYKKWWGPYQIAELICFWAKPTKDEFGHLQPPDWVHNFGTWLAESRTGEDSWITKLCEWIEQKRKRHIYVHIDHYDTWSMDNTLAHIILPMLKQLKETKHGSPHVDDFDCPQHLWSTQAKPKERDYDTDEFWHERWDYVLQEMIWAFEQELDPDADLKFFTLNPDPKLPLEERTNYDEAGHRHWQHRKQKGFQLFGKYYGALWD